MLKVSARLPSAFNLHPMAPRVPQPANHISSSPGNWEGLEGIRTVNGPMGRYVAATAPTLTPADG